MPTDLSHFPRIPKPIPGIWECPFPFSHHPLGGGNVGMAYSCATPFPQCKMQFTPEIPAFNPTKTAEVEGSRLAAFLDQERARGWVAISATCTGAVWSLTFVRRDPPNQTNPPETN